MLKKLFLNCIFIFLALITMTNVGFAVARTWDGGGATNNWSDAANWSGDAIPTSADDAIFDATNTKNAAIDQTFTVSTLQIKSGYTGTITQGAGVNLTINSGFTQAAGTFQGSDGAFNFGGASTVSGGTFAGGSGQITQVGNVLFTLSGGVFSSAGNASFHYILQSAGTLNAPAGTMTISNLVLNGGTFNANGGTTVLNGTYLSAPNVVFHNLTVNSGFNQNVSNAPTVNGTLSLVDGTLNGSPINANGAISYAATFDGGSTQIQFNDAATRTVNLPAVSNLLGMIIDNPNITVTTSGAAASTIIGGNTEVRRGVFQQGGAQLNFGPGAAGGGNAYSLTVAGGTFQGSSAPLAFNNGGGLFITSGSFSGGTGLISGAFGIQINQSGGTFSTGGDLDVTSFTLSGGTFNAPAGTMTVVADWSHPTGGTFNAGTTGTVKFTGYQTYNCINQILINVNVTETFNNLTIANSLCNQRYISAGDTLIVNGDFRIAYGKIAGGRVRPLGTTTIEATNVGYGGSTIVEYVTPNKSFVINNPASAADMFPIEMNAANSTLTSAGAGKINFFGMTLTNGTVNQGSNVWDISAFPGYAQSGGTFNGSAAALFISNGTGNPLLTGGVFSGGAGKVTGSFRITGGAMSIAGDMDTSDFSIEGGTFNAPLGTMRFTGGNGNCYFRHTLGGTFNARTGTIETQFGGCAFDVNQTETFYNLRFSGGNQSNFISANDELIVSNLFNVNGGGSSGGSIIANGDMNYTNGGVFNGNATTIVKFQDAAARTVNLSPSGASFGAYPTVVNNPNVSINTNLNADENFLVKQLTLQQGVFNQGAGRAAVGAYNQSGGTYNGGTFSQAFGTLNSFENFTLTGGDFNAAPSMTFTGNFTHTTATGNFNEGTGTVYFYSTFFGTNGTIDVNSSETFYNVAFYSGNGTNIAVGDRIIVNGTTTLRSGALNGGTIEAKGDVNAVRANLGGSFQGGTTSVIFSGATNQTFSNPDGFASFGGTWTVNKPNSASLAENNFAPAAPTSLLVAGTIGSQNGSAYVPLNIVSGNVIETGAYNLFLSSLQIAPGASLVNEFGGSLVLAGDVVNDGNIYFDAGGSDCQQPDGILIRSSISGTRRSWNGSGLFRLIDVDVKDQAGSAVITAYSGTDSGNNGANWMFTTTCAAPTAASVTISGRVLTTAGRAVSKAFVQITDRDGAARIALTNAFGFYSFTDVRVGETYLLSIGHKNRKFLNSTKVVTVTEEMNNVNFVANE